MKSVPDYHHISDQGISVIRAAITWTKGGYGEQ